VVLCVFMNAEGGKKTHQAEEGFFFGDTKIGMKSVREVKEYVVHPNELKSLKMGQVQIVCTKVDVHLCIMKISKAVDVQKDKGHTSHYLGKKEDLRAQDLF
jgi:hypothetical protein